MVKVEQAEAGALEFLGGKPELIRRGHFDNIDLAMLIHTTSRPEDKLAGVAVSNNGCVVKTVRYMGRPAHAGSVPHLGINALYGFKGTQFLTALLRKYSLFMPLTSRTSPPVGLDVRCLAPLRISHEVVCS